jgi:hypothetical protein
MGQATMAGRSGPSPEGQAPWLGPMGSGPGPIGPGPMGWAHGPGPWAGPLGPVGPVRQSRDPGPEPWATTFFLDVFLKSMNYMLVGAKVAFPEGPPNKVYNAALRRIITKGRLLSLRQRLPTSPPQTFQNTSEIPYTRSTLFPSPTPLYPTRYPLGTFATFQRSYYL